MSPVAPSPDRLPAAAQTRDDDDVAYLDAAGLYEAFRRRTLSPVEVASRLIDRIEALNPAVNAIVHFDRDKTQAMARASEQRHRSGEPHSKLDGVPCTVKDLSSIAGWPRRRGSLAFERASCLEDTPCVARLREAGVVFLGKTATPDGGCKVTTRSAVHGVTLNPYDLSKTPGGSSGGAAASLAMGFGPLAVGSDGAGSIRIPASLTNVFGLKPGFGRVPAFPPDIDMPHSVVGPMSRTVADAAAMLEVMSRPEPRDPYAWPIPFVLPHDLTAPNLSDLKIAFSARLGCRAPLVDPEIDRLVASSVPLLRAAGAKIVDAEPVWPIDPLVPFGVFWATSCMATVAGFSEAKKLLLDPLLLHEADRGRKMTIADYQRAIQDRMSIATESKSFFNRFDILLGPVLPVAAWSADLDVPEGYADADWDWCPYTYPWNMVGQPAASVPIGFTADGLPVGVQIIGRMGAEADVLRTAAVIEQCTGLKGQYPRR